MAIETFFSKKEQQKESIIDLVYNIIDSKIQYLNHQAKGIIRPLSFNNTSADLIKEEATSDALSLEEAEKIFLKFEEQSRQMKCLLYLRKWLNSTNATVALALLTDNILFEFTVQEIAHILNIHIKQNAA